MRDLRDMWDVWDLRGMRDLRDLWDLWDLWDLRDQWDLWDLRDLWDQWGLWDLWDLRDLWDMRPSGGTTHARLRPRRFSRRLGSRPLPRPGLDVACLGPRRGGAMPVSKVAAATRAFVGVLLAFARSYEVALTVNRDSGPDELLKAYRKLLLKTHPDKGGKKRDQQRLQEAKEQFEKTRGGTSAAGGRPRAAGGPGDLVVAAASKRRKRAEFRVNSTVVLLTYQGVKTLAQWHRFVAFVKRSLKKWKAFRWAATLEACETGGLHTHLTLQFTEEVDKTAQSFRFEGITPNVSQGDYLGEGVNKKRYQTSVNRGFFYVFADKLGTQREADGRPCFEGNHVPVWVKAQKGQSRYAVKGKWCENLWQERKLGHDEYENYLHLARDGVISRKRNFDEVKKWEDARDEAAERKAATERVRKKLFKPFEDVPAATTWLSLFKDEADRYPFMIVLAPSRAGKTEWAKSLFKNPLVVQVGELDHFPDGLRKFNRRVHDGIVLDDMRDFYFCVRHQEKMQGKVDAPAEFASTPSGQHAFQKWLWKVPMVVTANLTTRNADLLENNDFLGNPNNRVLVHRAAPPGVGAGGGEG